MQHYSLWAGGVLRREIRVDYPSIYTVAAKSADMARQAQRMSAVCKCCRRGNGNC